MTENIVLLSLPCLFPLNLFEMKISDKFVYCKLKVNELTEKMSVRLHLNIVIITITLLLLLLVVWGLEKVHREAEVASVRPGEHGRLVHVQVEGAASVDEHQHEQSERWPSSRHVCRWRPPRWTDEDTDEGDASEFARVPTSESTHRESPNWFNSVLTAALLHNRTENKSSSTLMLDKPHFRRVVTLIKSERSVWLQLGSVRRSVSLF